MHKCRQRYLIHVEGPGNIRTIVWNDWHMCLSDIYIYIYTDIYIYIYIYGGHLKFDMVWSWCTHANLYTCLKRLRWLKTKTVSSSTHIAAWKHRYVNSTHGQFIAAASRQQQASHASMSRNILTYIHARIYIYIYTHTNIETHTLPYTYTHT